ncbi:hypothetical protein evm_003388 [Chilo suppressalis]|nr:hypothetical protein evm_003388 [Chilo suppressalis]
MYTYHPDPHNVSAIRDQYIHLLSDFLYRAPTDKMVKLLLEQNVPVYMYVLNTTVEAYNWTEWRLYPHDAERIFLTGAPFMDQEFFPLKQRIDRQMWTPNDRNMSHFFMKAYSDFARFGAQYGFTKNRSTTDAGATMLKYIFNAWEKSQNALGVFCDLSKAFDCVNHQTLLRKLNHYGIKDSAQKLVQSYLTERTQIVDINGVTLDHKLQWNPHITTLAGKLSSAAYAIYKIRRLTDADTARTIYFSYFHIIMSYGILGHGR